MKSPLLLILVFSASFLLSCKEDQDGALRVNDQTFFIAENSPKGTVVGTIAASSASELSFTIISGNGLSSFLLDAATGTITVDSSSTLDFERDRTFLLAVSVTDAVITQNVTIKINLVDIKEPPAELVFDSIAYVIKDGLVTDRGAVQVVDQPGETHYKYDFALLNDNLSVKVEGEDISYEADNPTFILYSELFSPGPSSFRGTTFQYLDTEDLSKFEVEGNAFFQGVRLVVIDGEEHTT
ncbi:MAG: cadherin repeat domain-containing protein, partial [Ekhidna sp.]|nr:cadherin repeat domain-containing protein [Ekhidna sp.]